MIAPVIDKYEVHQKLGEGATATVYRGRHVAIGKDVAIKVLHPHLCASARYRERFHREARAVGRLNHDNIVSILDYSGQNADDCYIVTELVDGVTLLGLIEECGRVPSEILVAIGMELASALAYAHDHGIIHRDIKPENVMVRRDGVVKLMDFGVARVLDESQITLDGSLLGSPAYMSPQQAVDEKLDGRSDLFSLGTVLFHAVTGHIPFAGTNASIILRNIIDGQRAEVLELNPEAAPALAAVIDKLLQTRAEDRYATATEVESALAAVLAESGLTLDNPRVNLRAWLVNPKDVNEALAEHLQTDLLTRGKKRLADGDTLGALQLFNRLLAMDENHAEVLALIQSLHAPPARRPRVGLWMLGAAAGLLGFGVGAWALYPREVGGEPAVTPAPKPPAALTAVIPAAVERVTAEPKPAGIATPVAIEPGPVAAASPPDPRSVRSSRVPGSKASPSESPSPAAPGSVVLDITQSVEVFVDGARLGAFHNGDRFDTWVGTDRHPIQLQAGSHVLELKNSAAEPYTRTLVVGAGETVRVKAELKPRESTFIVNNRLPADCVLTLGGVKYGTPAEFGWKFRKPDDPDAHAQFDCGARGHYDFPLPSLQPGDQWILPPELPAGLKP